MARTKTNTQNDAFKHLTEKEVNFLSNLKITQKHTNVYLNVWRNKAAN